jgi:hypothetical protein
VSDGQIWDLAGLRPHVVWHPEPARTRRGGASLLVLVVLASAGGACGLAGDRPVSLASCAHFVAAVRTSQPSYASGQTVIITVTQANDGPACTIPPQPCGPPAAFASARNSAGKDVWDSSASKTSPGVGTCPPGPVPPMTWTAHYSDTQKLGWMQDECTQGPVLPGRTNPDCPGTQVPAGTYRIAGVFYWSDGRFVGQGPSASATVTISG